MAGNVRVFPGKVFVGHIAVQLFPPKPGGFQWPGFSVKLPDGSILGAIIYDDWRRDLLPEGIALLGIAQAETEGAGVLLHAYTVTADGRRHECTFDYCSCAESEWELCRTALGEVHRKLTEKGGDDGR